MRLSRFRIRTMMVAVAVVAVIVGAGTLYRRTADYKAHAAYCAEMANYCALNYPLWDESEANRREQLDYWDRQSHKYEFAARHPWLPVKPEPPPFQPTPPPFPAPPLPPLE